MKRKPKQTSSNDTFRVEGKSYPVVDRLRVRGRSYLLLKRIGNAGRVRYLAVDPTAGPGGELRALLVLPSSPATRQHLAALKRGTVNNVNVPRLFDYAHKRGEVTLVLDWIPGPTLEHQLALIRSGKKPRPSPYEAVRIVRGLAHGLSRLHYKRQVIHGDIKPANLILSRASGALVTIDFGSAWLGEAAASRDEGDGRSAAYAAPEQQAMDSVPDFRADQFAASVVLYELLTLELPYDQLGGKAGRAEYREEMKAALVPPSRFALPGWKIPRAIWDKIDATVATGMALDREDRFPTHKQWLSALDATFFALKHPPALSPLHAALTKFVETCGDFLQRRPRDR